MAPISIGFGLGMSCTSEVFSEVPSPSPMDPDASAYIEAVESALGSSITGTQRTAIDTFIVEEKSGDRWTSLKRIYLPIWGVAAANALCMKSLTSGTFVGGVTHGAGYVQSDGTTGYFDLGVSPSALDFTSGSGFLFSLVNNKVTEALPTYAIGANSAISQRAYLNVQDVVIEARIGTLASRVTLGLSYVGQGFILTGSRTSNTRLALRVRHASGIETPAPNTGSSIVSQPVHNLFALNMNSAGSPAAGGYSKSPTGAYGAGLGISDEDTDAFTLALKTLWETCTGLTLP